MDKTIKFWFDEKEDIFYISLKPGIAVDSEEVEENTRIEYDENGNIIGIEIYNISKIIASSIAKHLTEILQYGKLIGKQM